MRDRRGIGRRPNWAPWTAALVVLLFNATFFAVPAAATTVYTAVSSGDWTSPATWSRGVTPPLATAFADVVTIPKGFEPARPCYGLTP